MSMTGIHHMLPLPLFSAFFLTLMRNTVRWAKMTITRGTVYKYLGLTITYYSTGKVIFSMINYIGNMLDDIPKDLKGESATPD